jgi:hypothetical protein
MVSYVENSTDTRRTLLYNEQKLSEGKALFLGAFNYWQEDAELRFEDKLRRSPLPVSSNAPAWMQPSKTLPFPGSSNYHPKTSPFFKGPMLTLLKSSAFYLASPLNRTICTKCVRSNGSHCGWPAVLGCTYKV